jgi:hypothetical protein
LPRRATTARRPNASATTCGRSHSTAD